MLIYNSQKEFIGIDEKNLKILGFYDLSSLKAEVTDFADLFVKTPGYVHNFKHVHWIDFITCNDSFEEIQAIINVKNKNFTCSISIENIFLTDKASTKGYIVYLNDLQEISSDETIFTHSDKAKFANPNIVDAFEDEEIELIDEDYDSAYMYDPWRASVELGLPLELIEEFMQDYIFQTKDMHEKIFSALDLGDFEQVKLLSRQLKSTASNLKIRDAFETLNALENAIDGDKIRENLDAFYKIIAKLTGEEMAIEKALQIKKDEDDAPPKDLLDIKDSQVPDKIEIAELADDNFLTLDEIQSTEILEVEEEFSKESIASKIGLNEQSFDELLEEYLEQSISVIAQVKSAIKDEDLKSIKQAAKKLKDMNASMKIDIFEDALEKLASSRNKSEINKAIEDIEMGIFKISAI